MESGTELDRILTLSRDASGTNFQGSAAAQSRLVESID